MVMLQLEKLTKYFGGLAAVKDVDMEIREGEVLSLIGPNGAGKTTLFNCVTGIYPPTSGQIIFQGESLLGLKPHDVAARGIARTFQLTRLFRRLTVLENVLIGQHRHLRSGLREAIFGRKGGKQETARHQEALHLLEFVNLAAKKDVLAENLALGEQKHLQLAIALATKPALLLLDEPAGGLNPRETEELIELIAKVRDSGITVFLIEHDMRLVMDISDRIVVLNYGQKIAEGSPEEISRNPEVIEAYLGRREG
ncbi:MAG TPA: ABC transporter ATP-binding protein [Anaerolineae bacterium]|nr:ABC transporter ATP-binding protein [Anaerolineae bacterium]